MDRIKIARQFLLEHLCHGPMMATELQDKLEDSPTRFSNRILVRARNELEIVLLAENDQWYWSLPQHVEALKSNSHSHR